LNLRDRARAWLGIKDPPAERHAAQITQAAISAFGRKAEKRLELKLPDLPPGVRPKNAPTIAMDDSTGQNFPLNWANTMSGIGCGLYFPGYPYLAELSQRPEYRSPIETIAEEMTRKWIEFKSTGDKDVTDKIEKITAAFVKHDLQGKFRKAIELDGYFGRGQIFIDDGTGLAGRGDPLLLTDKTLTIGGLKGFKVIEPMWTTPVVWNANDPTADDFYKPTDWYVLGTRTSATRLINFISRPLPDLLKPSYNFSGISLAQMLQNYVNQWLRTKDSVSMLIHNFSVLALLCDMAQYMADASGQQLLARIQMFIANRDNQGLMALNKETEELTQQAVPLGTLDALQAQAQEHMCAVTRIPLVKQFGVSPSGLNATSEFEIVVFYDYIAAMQEKVLDVPIRQCLKAIQLDLFGEIDETIVHDYVPLKELDGEALARVRKSDGERDTAYIAAGVVSPDEVRSKLQTDQDSGYTNLSGDAPEPPAIGLMNAESKLNGSDNEGGEDALPQDLIPPSHLQDNGGWSITGAVT
jgi:uncharacterized protein